MSWSAEKIYNKGDGPDSTNRKLNWRTYLKALFNCGPYHPKHVVCGCHVISGRYYCETEDHIITSKRGPKLKEKICLDCMKSILNSNIVASLTASTHVVHVVGDWNIKKDSFLRAVSYTHLTLPTKRIV